MTIPADWTAAKLPPATDPMKEAAIAVALTPGVKRGSSSGGGGGAWGPQKVRAPSLRRRVEEVL